MACTGLVDFIKKEGASLQKVLDPEQMNTFEKWAREIPSEDQVGHLIPIQKIPMKRLGIYLSNLIPEFPQGEDSI